MTEWIQNAWRGWQHYITQGKLAAVFFAVLLFLWFCKKGTNRKPLLLYATGMAVCCVLPLTAAALMAYQTKFYDYEWIWSMVPLTAVSAWGIVLFLDTVWPGFEPAKRRQGLTATVLAAAVVLLGGSLGNGFRDGEEREKERRHAYRVLEQVKENCGGDEICLWAPREILEYAREADGAIRLPYGRSMWNDALKGYAYDVYRDQQKIMYRWMEGVGGTGLEGTGHIAEDMTAEREAWPEGGDPWAFGRAEEYAGYALEAGVTCILLPGDAAPEILGQMEEALGVEAQKLEDYWIFYGWTD